MSTTIDQRVVEMRFDNKQFQSNVSETMSTLDKLKQKLHLPGATKGLADVSAAANKCDMSVLSKGVETVQTKFSALQVIGVTALANITNSAVNAGKRIASSLFVDPVRSGFQEYELKMGSIQTIMASTGESLETVNKYLNELNEYSDKTIYSFQDMTSNIGKFTNAGVKLEDAVLAMKGISNEAAVSGANANEASRAMYNFAQALSAGYVKLMDWKSIELANMATVDFKNNLMETAVSVGTLTKTSDGMYKTLEGNVLSATKNFNETLNDQWMTSEVLINTLKNYADETTEIGKKATKAATEVKTFSQMMDALKESAQSGWAQTWEIIFGDFEEGKTLWTGINTILDGFLGKLTDIRNTVLTTAFASPWEQVSKKIEDAGIPLDEFKKKVVETAKEHGYSFDKMKEDQNEFDYLLQNGWLSNRGNFLSVLKKFTKGIDDVSDSQEDLNAKLKKFQKVVKQVWNGDYKNGAERVKRLTEAGYDYAEVQELVNKTVNDHKLDLEDLTDAQLKHIGYTDEQIEAIKQLKEEAEKANTPLSKLIERLEKPSGRDLLIDSFKNFGKELAKLFKAAGEAWDEVFGDLNAGEGLYGFIETIHDLSESFTISEEKAESFKNICKGLLDLFQISHSVVTMSLTGGLKILNAVFEVFGTNMLEVLESIALWISKGAAWLRQNTLFMDTWKKIGTILGHVIKVVKECFDVFMELEVVKDLIQDIKDLFSNMFGDLNVNFSLGLVENVVKEISRIGDIVKDWIKGIDSAENIGMYVVTGLAKGLWFGIKFLGKAVYSIGSFILTKLCEVLGVESPSWKAFNIALDVIRGFVNGLAEGAKWIWSGIKQIGADILEAFRNLDFGKVLAVVFAAGLLLTIKKIADVVGMIMKPINKVSDSIGKFGKMCDTIGDAVQNKFKPDKLTSVSKAIQRFAIAIGILALSVALLTRIESGKLWGAIGAIAVLAVIMGGLAIAVNKWGGGSGGDISIDTKGIVSVVLSISAAVLILAGALKLMSSIQNPVQSVLLLASIIGALGIMLKVIGKSIDLRMAADIHKVGSMLKKIAVAIGMMVLVIKLASMLKPNELQNGIKAVAMIELLFIGLIAVSKLAGNNSDKAGKMLRNMSLSLLVMLGVIKIAAKIDQGDLRRGMKVVAYLEIMFAGLMAISRIAGQNAAKVGGSMILMAGALLLAVNVMHIAGALSMEDIVKGTIVIAALGTMFTALIAATNFAKGKVVQAGLMLLLMSGALLIVAGALFIISKMNVKELLPALGIVSVISALFAGLIVATGKSKDIEKTLVKMAIVIGILGALIIMIAHLPVEKALSASASLSMVMLSFAAILKATEHAEDMKSVRKTLTQILLVTIALAAIVAALAFVPNPDAAIKNSIALSILLNAFASALLILDKTHTITKSAINGLDNMLGVAAGLALIVIALSFATNTEAAMSNTIALSILLNAFAASLVILDRVRNISPTALSALVPMLGVVAGLALILGVLSVLDCKPSIETAGALSVLLLSLSVAVLILSRVGPMAAFVQPALIALGELVAAIAVVLLAFAGLNKLFPGLQKFLESGIPLLETLGKALGSFFGSIVDGFMDSATESFPELGKRLSEFMENAEGFITGAGNIKPEIVGNIKNLASAIVALTAADLINRMTNLINFGDSLGKLGTQLSNFMNNAKDFITGADSIKPEISTGIKSLADAILELTKANLLDSFAQMFAGGTSLDVFGEQLGSFGKSLKDFAVSVEGINVEAIVGAAEASMALSNLASSIPNFGGMVSWFTGDNKIDEFGEQLITFGYHLRTYSYAVTGIMLEPIKNSVEAAKALSDLANSLPNTGGMASWFAGDNDINAFGEQLVPFGYHLKNYSYAVYGLMIEPIKNSIKAAELLVDLANTIPNMGGLFSAFTGTNSMSAFGLSLSNFGTSMKSYADSVEGIKVENISNSITATKKLVELNNIIPDSSFFENLGSALGMGDGSGFGSKIISFGKKLAEFSGIAAGIDAGQISSCVSAAEKLRKLINNLAGIDISGVSSFNSGLSQLAKANIQGFISAFKINVPTMSAIGGELMNAIKTGMNSKRTLLITLINKTLTEMINLIKSRRVLFTVAGIELTMGLLNGINRHKSMISTAYIATIAAALSTINLYYQSFYDAGAYLVSGFTRGISDNIRSAATASARMAAAAEKAAEDELDINSPSKVGYGIGGFFGMGFVNALKVYADKSYVAAKDIGESAKRGLNAAIERMNSAIDSDMNLNPTITPVIDLTDANKKMDSLTSMFGLKPSLSNVGAINRAINRNQNGTTNDVISAIDKVRNKLDNLGNTSYNINGITYDDGSSVAQAIETIVRAIVVDGRA